MRIAITSLFFVLCGSVSMAATFDYPRLYGYPVDATTWDYLSGDASYYNKVAADAFCRLQTYRYAANYNAYSDVNYHGGTTRFNSAGATSYCSFCQWYFTSITCE